MVDATGGEHRPGQAEMCDAVADALDGGHHLVVEAPTGIGKSYAVAVAVASWLGAARLAHLNGELRTGVDPDDDPGPPRVVVATATRALQDQLVDHDLPTVAAVCDEHGAGFSFSLLKGRSNYLCLARAAEASGALLDEDRRTAAEMIEAATTLDDGERSRLPDTDDPTWRMLSVSSDECPGAKSCSVGERCWAEVARRRAASSDVVVVNTALYAANLMADGAVLPDHDAVIIDEAHALADIVIDAASVRVTAGRLRAIERMTRAWGGDGSGDRLQRAADGLRGVLEGGEGETDPTDGDLAVYLADARAAARDIARVATTDGSDEALQAAATAGNLADDLELLLEGDGLDRVVWIDSDEALQCAPVEADQLTRQLLWPARTVVCTSATLRGADPSGQPSFTPLLRALGAPSTTRTLSVDSPFDYRNQGILYVPKGRIPSPKEPGWAEGVVDELWTLACAAGGRTLALFTSRSATESATAALRARVESAPSTSPGAKLEVFTQWDASRQRLIDAMSSRPGVVVCATRSFWTGIDIPGDACVVVAIDRLPFPRPDDPLMAARRRAAESRGANAFLSVDVPAAATQLAQGVGRLIRSTDDRGVVAILDTRLATARWRSHLLAALPDLRRSVDPDEVATLLRST